MFYGCADRKCEFFKWADENENPNDRLGNNNRYFF